MGHNQHIHKFNPEPYYVFLCFKPPQEEKKQQRTVKIEGAADGAGDWDEEDGEMAKLDSDSEMEANPEEQDTED